MNKDYSGWTYNELRAEARARRLDVDGDARTKAALIAALTKHDEDRAAEAERIALSDSESPKDIDSMNEIERALFEKVPRPEVSLKVWGDRSANRNRVEESLRVKNLPADYVYGWASISAGDGEDLGNWLSLGWIKATADMVTNDPSNTRKIYVPQYEDASGFVRHRDCYLVIANRRIVEARKRTRASDWNDKVEATFDARGRDKAAKGTVVDQGRQYRRTSQWRPEDGLTEGD